MTQAVRATPLGIRVTTYAELEKIVGAFARGDLQLLRRKRSRGRNCPLRHRSDLRLGPVRGRRLLATAPFGRKSCGRSRRAHAYLEALGAVLYRADRFEAAVQRLNEAIKAQEKGGSAWDWLFLAMAHHRLGHTDEAKKWLGKAAEWIEQATQKKSKDPDTKLSWQQRLELQILRHEAEALIKGGAK